MHECKDAKASFKFCKHKLHKNPFNNDRRIAYIKDKSKYKRALKIAKKQFSQKEFSKLEALRKTDTKSFWKGIKKLVHRKSDSNIFSVSEWVLYFHNLYSTIIVISLMISFINM